MISTWWKRQGKWIKVYHKANFDQALAYANNSIVHGGITERIELRDDDNNEVLRVIYDNNWPVA